MPAPPHTIKPQTLRKWCRRHAEKREWARRAAFKETPASYFPRKLMALLEEMSEHRKWGFPSMARLAHRRFSIILKDRARFLHPDR